MSDVHRLGDDDFDALLRAHYNPPDLERCHREPAWRPRSRRGPVVARRLLQAAVLAAAFAGGWAFGRPGTPSPPAARAVSAEPAFLIAEVQRTSSAYLAALSAASTVQSDSVLDLVDELAAQTLLSASQRLVEGDRPQPEAVKLLLAAASLQRARSGAQNALRAVSF